MQELALNCETCMVQILSVIVSAGSSLRGLTMACSTAYIRFQYGQMRERLSQTDPVAQVASRHKDTEAYRGLSSFVQLATCAL